MDRIPERLRTAAEGVERATQMVADAKSQRNRATGDVNASYSGLKKEDTAEWQAAAMLEGAEMARKRLEDFADQANAGKVHYDARELKRRIWSAFADFDNAASKGTGT